MRESLVLALANPGGSDIWFCWVEKAGLLCITKGKEATSQGQGLHQPGGWLGGRTETPLQGILSPAEILKGAQGLDLRWRLDRNQRSADLWHHIFKRSAPSWGRPEPEGTWWSYSESTCCVPGNWDIMVWPLGRSCLLFTELAVIFFEHVVRE